MSPLLCGVSLSATSASPPSRRLITCAEASSPVPASAPAPRTVAPVARKLRLPESAGAPSPEPEPEPVPEQPFPAFGSAGLNPAKR